MEQEEEEKKKEEAYCCTITHFFNGDKKVEYDLNRFLV